MMRAIVIFLLLLFIGAAGFAFYVFQTKKLPQDVVKLEIIGPTEIEMLEDAEYTVIFKNKGGTVLEDVSILFEYPEGAIPVEDKVKVVRKEVGELLPGEEQSSRFRLRLLGEEGKTKTMRAKISYKPKGLQAFFEAETTLTIVIKTVPLVLEFDLPSKVESGAVNFSLNWRSYSREPLANVNLRVDYPVGFEFDRSDPLGLTPDEWRIGLLNRGDGGRIDVSGELRGKELEEKIFRAQLLAFNEIEQKTIVVKEISKGVEIVNPSIFISQWVNGKQDYAANPGEDLHFEVFFRNTSETIRKDVLLLIELDTKALDFESVRVPLGAWKKESRILLWDSRVMPELAVLGPYKEGKVEFWAKVKDNFSDLKPDDRNLLIISRVGVAQEKNEFRVKVNSKIELSQQAFYAMPSEALAYLPSIQSTGKKPENAGPAPPVAGEKTTYTIVWSLKNYFNTLANVKVRASLPPYVKAVLFDGDIRQEGQEVIWDVKEVAPFQGVYASSLTRVFQIEAVPPQSYVKQALPLIDSVKVEAEDDFTKAFLEIEGKPIDSLLPDDPANGGVVKPAIESRIE